MILLFSSPWLAPLVLLPIALLFIFIGCGARTGPRVPDPPVRPTPEPAPPLSFERPVRVSGLWQTHIMKVEPFTGTPVASVLVDGVDVIDHDINRGHWICFSTSEGLFIRNFPDFPSPGTLPANRLLVGSPPTITGIDILSDSSRAVYAQSGRIWLKWLGGTSAPIPMTQELMSDNDPRASDPVFTPISAVVFFIRYRMNMDSGGNPVTTDHQIWRMYGSDGSGLTQVFSGSPVPAIYGLQVTFRGDVLLYVTGPDANPSIIRLDLASGTTSVLVSNAKDPAINPSWTQLAFVRNGQIWTCNFDGSSCSNFRQVSEGPSDRRPAWIN